MLARRRCYEARPELATSGGGAHQPFLNVIWALIGVRLAFEMFCLCAIAVSCARDAVIKWCRVFMVGSAFVPLLLLSAATRVPMLDFVLADRKPKHFLLELLTLGICISIAKLFADTYFLLRVAQNGLVWSNWLRYAYSKKRQ